MTYNVVEASDWTVMAEEPAGADVKLWLAPPGQERDAHSRWWLFKSVKYGLRPIAGSAERAPYRRNDDQAEKVACELARLLKIPSADLELAIRGGEEGVISRNVAPEGWALQSGNTMLSEYEGYLSCAEETKPKNRVGHNLQNIYNLLDGLKGPPNSEGAEMAAFDVFVGYLVLDAWIANTDRHAINWGVMLGDAGFRLAKSFDHGSALGSGLTDEDCSRVLAAGTVNWCNRGKAMRFEDGRGVTLVEMAQRGLDFAPGQSSVWIDHLTHLDRDDWRGVLDAMPGMSVARRRFIDEVLFENQRRLCNGD